MLNFENYKVEAVNVEINNHMKKIQPKNEGVEIFSAIVNGKDTSKYGDKVDKVLAYMKHLGQKAVDGDIQAKAEINSIRTIMIQAPLLKRLNLFDYMGTVTKVGYNEEVKYKVYQIQGKMAGQQANSGSFPFATHNWRTQVMSTKTITGGFAVDYREVASGNTDAMGVIQEQVITDIMNQMFYEVINELYTGIKNATGLKNFSEAATITKTAVDNAKNKARRFGNVAIMGDYSVISQMETFSGFTTATNTLQFSEAVMEEVRKTGLIKFYAGHPVVELPNTYNLTKLNTGGDFFETYLPEGLLYFIPTGTVNALQIGLKGGLTSMSATDINLRSEVQRFDIEFGTELIKEYIPFIGLVSDSSFTVDKR